MGFYLSKPITEKETITGDCSKFNYVLSGMQGSSKTLKFFFYIEYFFFLFKKFKKNTFSYFFAGWRTEMEDAHLNYIDSENNIYIFGVFDGHGGI